MEKVFALLTTKNGRMSFVSFLIIGYLENLRMLLKRNAGVSFGGVGMRSGVLGFFFFFSSCPQESGGRLRFVSFLKRTAFRGGGGQPKQPKVPPQKERKGFFFVPNLGGSGP